MNKKNEKQEVKESNNYEHKPNREFKASISKDGKFWIFKDITTHIVPRNYISKIQSELGKEKPKQLDLKASGASDKVE